MPTLPDIRQSSDWSCGRALLETFHAFWNVPLRPAIAALANPVSGLSPDSLDAALRASGFSVLSGNFSVPILKSLTKAGFVVGCLVQFEGVGHWVCVGSVARGKVYGNCPIRGPFSQLIGDWDELWIDSHWTGGSFRHWATCPFLND